MGSFEIHTWGSDVRCPLSHVGSLLEAPCQAGPLHHNNLLTGVRRVTAIVSKTNSRDFPTKATGEDLGIKSISKIKLISITFLSKSILLRTITKRVYHVPAVLFNPV